MLKKLVLTVVVVIVFVAVSGFLLPAEYKLSRSITIDASPADIYPAVANLKDWQEWSMWNTETYSDMKISYSGPESGKGARSEWTGESSGTGSQEITDAVTDDFIEYTLAFEEMESTGRITLTEIEVGRTRATLSMVGDMGANPIGRYMGLMMDGMMGPDFEKSLKGLKEVTEARAKAAEEKRAEEARQRRANRQRQGRNRQGRPGGGGQGGSGRPSRPGGGGGAEKASDTKASGTAEKAADGKSND